MTAGAFDTCKANPVNSDDGKVRTFCQFSFVFSWGKELQPP